MASKEELSGQGELQSLFHQSQSESRQSEPDRPGIGGRWDASTFQEEIRNEQDRLAKVRELGLSVGVSWSEIFDFMDEQERAVIAKEFRLPTYPEATKYGLSEYPSWRNILTGLLDLKSTASAQDIVEKVKVIRK